MSCIWILSHDRLEKLKAYDDAYTPPQKQDIHEQHRILTKHKFRHTMERLIQSLVEEDDVLSLADKSRLKKVLLSTLAFAPQNRPMTWEEAFETFQVKQCALLPFRRDLLIDDAFFQKCRITYYLERFTTYTPRIQRKSEQTM